MRYTELLDQNYITTAIDQLLAGDIPDCTAGVCSNLYTTVCELVASAHPDEIMNIRILLEPAIISYMAQKYNHDNWGVVFIIPYLACPIADTEEILARFPDAQLVSLAASEKLSWIYTRQPDKWVGKYLPERIEFLNFLKANVDLISATTELWK